MYVPNTSYYQSLGYQMPNRQSASLSQIPQQQVQQPPIVQTNSPFLKGRLVSSIEEARAQTIDFDGSVFYFPDLANRKIYTKQINMDGTSTLNMYELKEIPQPVMVTQGTEYITREEFEGTIKQLKTEMAPTQVSVPKEQAQPAPQPAPAAYNF